MAQDTVGNDRIRMLFNEPGVHPYMSVLLPDREGEWFPSVLLGARQLRYFHKGASFPRIIADGNEVDAGALVNIQSGSGGTAVSLSDIRGGFDIATEVSVQPGLPMVHVAHRLTPVPAAATEDGVAAPGGGVNRVFDRFDFVFAQGEETSTLDYSFVPHLRPKSDMVIGDHVFRSPVVMMRKGDVFFAIIPDLDLLEPAYAGSDARYYMDFQTSAGENHCPTVSFGIGRTRVKGHVYFENDFQRETPVQPGQTLVLGYYLVADRDGFGPHDTVSFLWERFGRKYFRTGVPQTAGWERYASQGMTRIFKRADLFRTFALEGQPCGGTIGIHFMARRGVRTMSLRELQRYLRYQEVILAASRRGIEQMSERPWAQRMYEKASYRYGPKTPPQVFLQSWFNNLRSAYGAYWFARKWNDNELLGHALAVKNLAILAPGEDGAIPAVCYPTDQGVFWSRGTRGFKHVDSYHTADCATTGYYMAQWFDDHEGDPRLLARCRRLAEYLMKLQLPSGAFPAWVDPGGGSPRVAAELKESATTAAPAMFLARLFHVENDVAYLDSAMKACDFVAREVIPRQKWFDYETFYSCSRKRLGLFDEHTGTFPQNTMSMYWAAVAFGLVYQATLDEEYLALGREVIDHLSLYQQVWDPPFLSINGFGGFGAMNTDAEWDDARQALMALALMDYYRLTGEEQYMERGISALRASFALMFIDENKAVAPGNMRIALPEEIGSVMENYGHFGHDHPVPGFIDSDWGAGSACHAAAYAQKHYGDIYIDVGRMKAFGINGCRVDRVEESVAGLLQLDVVSHVDPGAPVIVKLAGGSPSQRVEVNGVEARCTAVGEFSILL
ncbi:MAG: hypothetical protein ACYC99_10065 [Candidatus Geothermincolia bacterium]